MGRFRFFRIGAARGRLRRAARKRSASALRFTKRRFLNPKIAAAGLRRPYLGAYAFQTALAAAALMFTLWAAELLPGLDVARAVLISAMAATAFVLFIYPHSTQADPRHAVGGHAIAMAAAFPFAAFAGGIADGGFLEGGSLLFGAYAAAAVGAAILLMALAGAEHPPAAGTALAIVAHGFAWDLAAFVATAVLLMSAARLILKSRMHNL